MAVKLAFIVTADAETSLRNCNWTLPPVAPTATTKRAVMGMFVLAARTPVVAPVVALSAICSIAPSCCGRNIRQNLPDDRPGRNVERDGDARGRRRRLKCTDHFDQIGRVCYRCERQACDCRQCCCAVSDICRKLLPRPRIAAATFALLRKRLVRIGSGSDGQPCLIGDEIHLPSADGRFLLPPHQSARVSHACARCWASEGAAVHIADSERYEGITSILGPRHRRIDANNPIGSVGSPNITRSAACDDSRLFVQDPTPECLVPS